jgi:hypothetical protein
MARIKRLELTVKLLNVDYNATDPKDLLSSFGLQEFSLTGVADEDFIRELVDLCDRQRSPRPT